MNEVAKKYFNCSDIKGVELEDFGKSIESYAHWDARYLLGEYMTDGFYTEEEVISELTLAFFEGSGKYKAKYYTGGLMKFGKGKGCDFLRNNCIDKTVEKTEPLFSNEFFDNVKSQHKGSSNYYYDAACSSGRQSRAYHYFLRYDALSPKYTYIKDNIVGYLYANGCPVSKGSTKELNKDYYIGHCSSLGSSGDYGTELFYEYTEPGKEWKNIVYYNESKYYVPYTDETYSDHSFCYLSSLYKKDMVLKAELTRAVCYESFCSDRSLTIKIFDDYFVCPRQGGKIHVDGYKGEFYCPDYYLLCSGTVMCNDMYDCVEKKSEVKELSYYPDYTPETNQMLSVLENSYFNERENFEWSDNGKCPKFCKLCKKNRVCIKCVEDAFFLGNKKNGQIECLLYDELENGGYYLERGSNILFPCIDNCEFCETGTTCELCFHGYIYSIGHCFKEIVNCKDYSNDGKCSLCSHKFAFKEDNFQYYYTKDNGISYYPCNSQISNCKNCYYNNQDNKVKCYLCNTNFVVFVGDSTCLIKDKLDSSFLNMNETHVDLCANTISNCNKCINENTCTKCSNGFYMLNDNSKNCIALPEIKTDENYLNKDGSIYFSCSNSNYNDIQNYKKCSDKKSCSLCQETFTFIDGYN